LIRYYKIPRAQLLYKVHGDNFYFVAEWPEEPLWVPLKIYYLDALLSRGAKDVTSIINSKWGLLKYGRLVSAKERDCEIL